MIKKLMFLSKKVTTFGTYFRVQNSKLPLFWALNLEQTWRHMYGLSEEQDYEMETRFMGYSEVLHGTWVLLKARQDEKETLLSKRPYTSCALMQRLSTAGSFSAKSDDERGRPLTKHLSSSCQIAPSGAGHYGANVFREGQSSCRQGHPLRHHLCLNPRVFSKQEEATILND